MQAGTPKRSRRGGPPAVPRTPSTASARKRAQETRAMAQEDVQLNSMSAMDAKLIASMAAARGQQSYKDISSFGDAYEKRGRSIRQQNRIHDRILKHQKRVKYGAGSMDSVLKRRARAISKGDAAAANAALIQLGARVEDEFDGRGRYRRKRRKYRGRGMYTGQGSYLAAIGAGARMARPGAALATSLVGGVAGALGKKKFARRTTRIGGAVDTGLGILGGAGMYVRGRGDYQTVGGNSLVDGMGSTIPHFGTIGDETGALVIRHSEFIADIYGNKWVGGSNSEPFVNRTFSLNPGLTGSFPFGSQIANNFEEYEFGQLMFTYKSKVSQNLTTQDGQVGSILMYTDYNAADKPKISKQQVMQAYGNTNIKITDTGMHGIECDPSKIAGDGHRFVRSSPPGTAAGEGLSKYDHGLFQLMVVNSPEALSEQVVGELFVSYTLILRKPRVHTLYGLALDRDEHMVTCFDSDLFASSAVVKAGSKNSIGCKLTPIAVVADATTHGQVKITFPSSFAGDVCISMIKTGIDLGDGRPAAPSYLGEVTPLNVLPIEPYYDSGLQSQNWTMSYTLSTVAGSTERKTMNSTTWLHVNQAVSGTDNEVIIGSVHGPGDLNTSDVEGVKMWVSISRWNGREDTVPDTFLAAAAA